MMHHAWIDEVEHYCLEFKEWYAVKKAAAAFQLAKFLTFLTSYKSEGGYQGQKNLAENYIVLRKFFFSFFSCCCLVVVSPFIRPTYRSSEYCGCVQKELDAQLTRVTDSQAASLGEVQGVPYKSTLSIITQQKVLEKKQSTKRSEKSFSNTGKIVAFVLIVPKKKFLIWDIREK